MSDILKQTEILLTAKSSVDPDVAAFKHEIQVLIEDIGKVKSERISSSAFSLWNKFEAKVPEGTFDTNVIECGDKLVQAKKYKTACDLCYHWLLSRYNIINERGELSNDIEEAMNRADDVKQALILACIGYANTKFLLLKSSGFNEKSGSEVLFILRLLADTCKVALQKEKYYWLLHNSVALSFQLCCVMVDNGLYSQVIKYLLWCSVCMEKCVPLLLPCFLPLRSNLYCVVCKCYYGMGRPDHAEVFARRSIGKISELMQLQNKSSTPIRSEEEQSYREAAIKLGLMVFRRTVFESRKKTKSILRTKAKPPLKDILHQSLWPRSPTEKLITEMFVGQSAQFQAIFMALERSQDLLFESAPPQATLSELDQEAYLEVHQELVVAGADLALKTIRGVFGGSEASESVGISQQDTDASLMNLAVVGSDAIPLSSLVHFVRLLHSYTGYGEAYNVIADSLIESLETHPNNSTLCHLKMLQLLGVVDTVKKMKVESHLHSADDGDTGLVFKELNNMANIIECYSSFPHVLKEDKAMLSVSTLFLWEHLKRYFLDITSHTEASCEPILSHPFSQQLMRLLYLIHGLVMRFGLWAYHFPIAGEICIKLASLLEYKATHLRPDLTKLDTNDVEPELLQALQFDRASLLEAIKVLDEGLIGVRTARSTFNQKDHPSEGCTEEEEVELLHVELLVCWARVKMKLTSTVPHPAARSKAIACSKASSLKNKVEQQKKLEERRTQLRSLITASEDKVDTGDELRSASGRNDFLSALLIMEEAVLLSQLDHQQPSERRHAMTTLLDKSLALLKGRQAVEKTKPSPLPLLKGSRPSPLPPAPHLVEQSCDRMTIVPAEDYIPDSGQQIYWYALYGRAGTGSNIKVRLNDHHLRGCGVPVPAGKDCQLKVEGLKPNEVYTFAVAAYTRDGQLIGGNIGDTSLPHLAAHPLPLLAGFAHLSKCSYEVACLDVAMAASQVLWSHFVETATAEHDQESERPSSTVYRLKESVVESTSPQLLRQCVQCIFILMDATIKSSRLSFTALEWCSPPQGQQQKRTDICQRLLVVAGLSSRLQEVELSLQAIIMCYGLLAPLLQNDLITESTAKVTLECLYVLRDLPKAIILKLPKEQMKCIHHMIAVLGYQALKMLHSWHDRALGSIASTIKDLLSTTLTRPPAHSSIANSGVGKAGVTATKLKDISHSANQTTQSGAAKPAQRKSLSGEMQAPGRKKSKKGAAALQTAVVEEQKSEEMKALEALFIIWKVENTDQELTGQEDITLLYGILANESVHNAYKEVHKFRRRPRYLEFFLHLCSKALSDGQYADILEWSKEALAWLKRRNELLMQPKVLPLAKREPAVLAGDQARYSMVLQKYTVKPKDHVLRHPSRLAVKQPEALSVMVKSAALQTTDAKPPHQGGDKLNVALKLQPSRSAIPHGQITVTREDLLLKAKSVLQNLLTEYYHAVLRRRKLRVVCGEEYPWRSQLNLVLAQSQLEQFAAKLRSQTLCNDSYATPSEATSHFLSLDHTGVILQGIFPSDILEYEIFKKENASIIDLRENLRKPSTDNSKPSSRPPPASSEVHSLEDIPEDELETVNRALLSTASTLLSPEEAVPPSGDREQEVKSKKQLPRIVEDFQDIISNFGKASVLAHRGRLWSQLQNTCMEFYTSLHNSASIISQCPAPTNGPANEIVIALTYASAGRTLYMCSDALIDMIMQLDQQGLNLREQFPDVFVQAVQDKFIASHSVDLGFLVRFVLLTTHVLYSLQLWEKFIDLLCNFNDITSHKYGYITSPLLSKARDELLSRISSNQHAKKVDVLNPAAHIDPKTYDIYGPQGHALGLTAVSLSGSAQPPPRPSPPRSGPTSPAELLKQSRQLLSRYLSGVVGGVDHDDGEPIPPAVGSLASEQIDQVIQSYLTAIKALKGIKDGVTLTSIALHELGVIRFFSKDLKAASHCWQEGLGSLLGTKDVLNSWREVMRSTQSVFKKLTYQCLWIVVILAAKLAKYVYVNELDIKLEYTLLGTAAIKCLLHRGDVVLPSNLSFLPKLCGDVSEDPMEQIRYSHSGGLLGLTNQSVLEATAFLSSHLVEREHYQKAVPVLYLYRKYAFFICHSVEHCVQCNLLRVRVSSGMCVFSDAIQALKQLLNGVNLPQQFSQAKRPPESHGGKAIFDDHLPPTNPHNFKVLAYLLDRQLPPSLLSLYGPLLVNKLALVRAQFYVALAKTIPGMPSLSIIKRRAGSSRPATAVSTFSGYLGGHMDSEASQSGNSSGSAHQEQAATEGVGREKELMVPPMEEIKATLLQHADSLLLSAYEQDRDGEHKDILLQVGLYLTMSEVALQYHLPTVAVNTALACARLLQDEEACVHRLAVRPTTLTWLTCREMIAKCMTHHSGTPSHVLTDLCKDGVSESDACGLPEVGALFHWYMASYLLSQPGADSSSVEYHLQELLRLLKESQSLSLKCSLLKKQVQLHLACISCGSHQMQYSDLVELSRSLAEDLLQEGNSLSKVSLSRSHGNPKQAAELPNMYLPHHALQAQCKLLAGWGLRRTETTLEAQYCFSEGLLACRVALNRSSLLEGQLLYQLACTEACLLDHTSTCDYVKMFLHFLEVTAISSQSTSLLWLCEMAYQELSTFYLERIKLAQQTTLLREHCSPKPDSSTAQRNVKLMPDQSSPSRSGTGVSDGRVSSRQKVKDKHVDLMMFWLTTSALYNCHISKRKIDALVTDLGRKELNKAVTEKAMASLPDGILMNLTDKGKSSIYAAEDTFPPLTSLCPSHQSAVKAPSITWRKVVNLLTVINKRVYPTQQDPLLTTLLSDWMNEESTAIHHILQEHLKDPYEACVPALLPRLAVDHHTRLAAKQKLDLPTIPIVIPIQSQVERWYNTNEALLYSKWLKNTENGYFTLHLAFTAKEVKHISSFAIAAQVGIQVLTAVLHKAQISHLMSEVTESIKLLSSVKDTDNKSRKTSSSLLTEDLQAPVTGMIQEIYSLFNKQLPENYSISLSGATRLCQVLSDFSSCLEDACSTSSVHQFKGEVCNFIAAIAASKQLE